MQLVVPINLRETGKAMVYVAGNLNPWDLSSPRKL
jgi:hypothetical protein